MYWSVYLSYFFLNSYESSKDLTESTLSIQCMARFFSNHTHRQIKILLVYNKDYTCICVFSSTGLFFRSSLIASLVFAVIDCIFQWRETNLHKWEQQYQQIFQRMLLSMVLGYVLHIQPKEIINQTKDFILLEYTKRFAFLYVKYIRKIN